MSLGSAGHATGTHSVITTVYHYSSAIIAIAIEIVIVVTAAIVERLQCNYHALFSYWNTRTYKQTEPATGLSIRLHVHAFRTGK